MKCPVCEKWNRAGLPHCVYCGAEFPADAYNTSKPAWQDELRDREKPKSYIRVDESGFQEDNADPRDMLAQEMASLKERKRMGEEKQRELRARSADRGMAPSGRTVRTTKPVWAKNLTKISKGDFVIIQFGINDAGKTRFVDEAEFKKTMKEFASDVNAKGATPVICGPVANAGWTKKSKAGSAFQLTPSRRVYADYSKAVADELKIAFVDMTALTSAELAKIGKDAAIELFVGDTTKKGKPSFDTTHPSKAGAKRFAELFLAEVKAQNLPVATLFK